MGSIQAVIDNTGSSTPIVGGTPLKLFLPASFPWMDLYWPNGDDLKAADASDNALLVWPELVNRAKEYGRVWVQAPAGGVAAGATTDITLTYGSANSSNRATSNYSTLFSKRVADADTVALFHMDTFAGASTASTVNGYSMTLVGTPTQEAQDGGNLRVLSPPQAFASGSAIGFNGSSQYATVVGLLDTVPATGCVSFWFKYLVAPTGTDVLVGKTNVNSSGAITDGFTFGMQTASGNPIFAFNVWDAGVETECLMEPGFAWDTNWHHVCISWGSQLTLRIDGVIYGIATLSGGWPSGSSDPFSVGAQLVNGGASNYANVIIDELEVRNAEPLRTDVLTWFNRGGLPIHTEFDDWTRAAGNPLMVSSGSEDLGTVFEPRLIRKAAGDWVGVYTTGDTTDSHICGMTSTDGKTLTKTGTIVMGAGVGGISGDACRPFLFQDRDGSLHLFFSDSVATTNGSIHHATTSDGGTTWTDQGIILPYSDPDYPGWANSAVVYANGLYNWLVECRNSAGGYFTVYLTSETIGGAMTVVDTDNCAATLQQGAIGSASVGALLNDGTHFHFYPHQSRAGNLTSQIYHYRSLDCQRWEQMGGGDPVIDLADQAILAREDQCADASVYALPDSNELGMLFDIDDNHGGGIQADICGATISGTSSFSSLSAEYPQIRLLPPPAGATGAALLM